jgi:hypothetical protein
VLIVLTSLLLAAGAGQTDCMAHCNSDSARCFQSCKGSSRCMDRCQDRQASCGRTCNSNRTQALRAAEKRERVSRDDICGAKADGGIEYCTAEDRRAKRDAMSSREARALLKCKDAEGNPTVCEGELKGVDDQAAKLIPKNVCWGPGGEPIECPKDKR